MTRLSAALSILAITALTACSSSAPVQDGPTAGAASASEVAATPEQTTQTYSPGTFTFTTSGGGTGVLEVPAPAVSEIEELRQLVGGEPVEYITAAVDNRKGSDSINMYQVQMFDPQGRQYTYTGVDSYLDELRDKLPEDAPSETYNRFVDLSNAHLDDAAPLEVKNFVLVGEPVPTEITGITVYATGVFDPVSATPKR